MEAVDAARRGDYRWERGVTHPLCRVARPIFVNLLLCPVGESMRLMSEGGKGWQKEREGWVLLKVPRGDIDGVGEVK